VAFTTDDGSYGERGRVSDVLPGVIARTRADVVYACGPMAMLEAVQRVAGESYRGAGIPTQLAVEESMACGVGVCMTCVLPVIGADGQTTMARACVDGPVFSGDRIRWDALGSVPADALGAPTP
jgi:dihydroorotate dehydrogenase electron transfer subunit